MSLFRADPAGPIQRVGDATLFPGPPSGFHPYRVDSVAADGDGRYRHQLVPQEPATAFNVTADSPVATGPVAGYDLNNGQVAVGSVVFARLRGTGPDGDVYEFWAGTSADPSFYGVPIRDDADIKGVLTLSGGNYYFMSNLATGTEWFTRVSEVLWLPVNTSGPATNYMMWWRYSWADVAPTTSLGVELPPMLSPVELDGLISSGVAGPADPYTIGISTFAERWAPSAPGLGRSYSQVHGQGFSRYVGLAANPTGVVAVALVLGVPPFFFARHRYLPGTPTLDNADCLVAVRVSDLGAGTPNPAGMFTGLLTLPRG